MSDNAVSGHLRHAGDGVRENKKQRSEGGAIDKSTHAPQAAAMMPNDDLNRDYAAIARLMRQLDTQVEGFAINVSGMVDTMPAHEGLSALWEGLYRSSSSTRRNETATSTGSASASTDHANNEIKHTDELILGDEAEDQDDKLIFL